jgi:hypothetical protein
MKLRHLVSRMLWAKDKVEISYLLWKNIKEAWKFPSINFVALGFYLLSLRNMSTYSEKKTTKYYSPFHKRNAETVLKSETLRTVVFHTASSP